MAWRSGLAYSQDLRERVLAAVDAGRPVREVAPLFRVSISYICKALERRPATWRRGAVAAAARRSWQGMRRRCWPICGRIPTRRWLNCPLAVRDPRRERQQRLSLERAGAARLDAQKKAQRAAEQDRPDIAAARAAWRTAQPGLNPKRLVFLDGSRHYLERLRDEHGPPLRPQPARAAAGRAGATPPLEDFDPGRRPARRQHRRAARDRSRDEQRHLPRLCRATARTDPRTWRHRLCDNLQCHKAPGVRAAIEARGAELRYLPPYSPDHLGQCPKSNRAGLRQAEGPRPRQATSQPRRPLAHHRRLPRPPHHSRVLQLPRQLRLSTPDVKSL